MYAVFIVLFSMYLYAFDEYAGIDRVFVAEHVNLPVGTLFVSHNKKYMTLGDDVAFVESYVYDFRGAVQEVIGILLTDKELSLIHYMARRYFALYKNIVPLFVDDPLAFFVDKKVRNAVSGDRFVVNGHVLSISVSDGQQLLVFPDLWTLESHMAPYPKDNYLLWHHGLTHKQQISLFAAIAKGSSGVLCCTHGGIFRRWASLRSIILVEPNAWYYHNYQEPRYSVPDLLAAMADIYGAKLDFLSY